jgi:uncharacterized membrane protein
MAETSPGSAAAPPPPDAAQAAQTNLRSLAILGYVLYLLAPVNGITAIAAVILAYVKRDDARGTVWFSHFENMIVVFWVMLIASFVGLTSFLFSLSGMIVQGFAWPALSLITLPLLVGFLIIPIFTIWYLYRLVKGLVRASDDRAY